MEFPNDSRRELPDDSSQNNDRDFSMESLNDSQLRVLILWYIKYIYDIIYIYMIWYIYDI